MGKKQENSVKDQIPENQIAMADRPLAIPAAIGMDSVPAEAQEKKEKRLEDGDDQVALPAAAAAAKSGRPAGPVPPAAACAAARPHCRICRLLPLSCWSSLSAAHPLAGGGTHSRHQPCQRQNQGWLRGRQQLPSAPAVPPAALPPAAAAAAAAVVSPGLGLSGKEKRGRLLRTPAPGCTAPRGCRTGPAAAPGPPSSGCTNNLYCSGQGEAREPWFSPCRREAAARQAAPPFCAP